MLYFNARGAVNCVLVLYILCMDIPGEPLKIGRYLDCMVLPTSKVEDLVTRNSRIVNVTVTPRKVYRSVVNSHLV